MAFWKLQKSGGINRLPSEICCIQGHHCLWKTSYLGFEKWRSKGAQVATDRPLHGNPGLLRFKILEIAGVQQAQQKILSFFSLVFLPDFPNLPSLYAMHPATPTAVQRPIILFGETDMQRLWFFWPLLKS